MQKAVAKFIKKLCAEQLEVNKDNEQSLKAFTACRLILLNKNPGLRPIGVSEILRRIAGKPAHYKYAQVRKQVLKQQFMQHVIFMRQKNVK